MEHQRRRLLHRRRVSQCQAGIPAILVVTRGGRKQSDRLTAGVQLLLLLLLLLWILQSWIVFVLVMQLLMLMLLLILLLRSRR